MKNYLVVIYIVFTSCTSNQIDLGDIDISKWKKDKSGCTGYRLEQMKQFSEYGDNLLRFGERDITITLGIPDKTELYEKSQKFYYYYLTPRQSCSQKEPDVHYTLRMRFNAMGYCNEVLTLTE